jgi:hypothetical protein
MDVARAWKLAISIRKSAYIVPMGILLLLSVTGNVWLYRMAQGHRLQPTITEQAAGGGAKAATDAERLRLRRKAEAAATNARIQRLYDEINFLTRTSEQVMLRQASSRLPVKQDKLTETRNR